MILLRSEHAATNDPPRTAPWTRRYGKPDANTSFERRYWVVLGDILRCGADTDGCWAACFSGVATSNHYDYLESTAAMPRAQWMDGEIYLSARQQLYLFKLYKYLSPYCIRLEPETTPERSTPGNHGRYAAETIEDQWLIDLFCRFPNTARNCCIRHQRKQTASPRRNAQRCYFQHMETFPRTSPLHCPSIRHRLPYDELGH